MGGRTQKLRSPRSDPQRAMLYRMERELRGNTFALSPQKVLRETAERVALMYDLETWPRLVIYPRPKSAFAGRQYYDGRIWLNSSLKDGSGANMLTLLHELAHSVETEHGNDKAAHGPLFVGIYAYLLAKFNVLPLDASSAMCRRWGIKRVRPELCSPRALRAAARRKGVI